tara:strand:- start:70 stop:327 length:258 start_codon:yes stop_codon:yes gene_type:complete
MKFLKKLSKKTIFGLQPKGIALSWLLSQKSKSLKILDIGCRDGEFLKEVLNNLSESKLIGIDLDGDALELAKNNINSENCTLIQA